MPLSENEQRILSEIEAQLYQSDPALAREVGHTTVYTHSLRNAKWALAGFVVGLGVMIVSLSTHYVLAFVGFLIMLACALIFERNARHLGKTGLSQFSQRVRASGLTERMADPGQRFRDRRNRDQPPPE